MTAGRLRLQRVAGQNVFVRWVASGGLTGPTDARLLRSGVRCWGLGLTGAHMAGGQRLWPEATGQNSAIRVVQGETHAARQRRTTIFAGSCHWYLLIINRSNTASVTIHSRFSVPGTNWPNRPLKISWQRRQMSTS